MEQCIPRRYARIGRRCAPSMSPWWAEASSVWPRRGRSRSTVVCAAWCSRPRTASPRTRPATTAASSTPASTTSRARSRRALRRGRRGALPLLRRSTASPTSAAARSSSPSREHELPRLDELERRGRANGLAGPAPARRPRRSASTSRTPRGIAGLFVPETGIVDYVAVAEAYAAERARRRRRGADRRRGDARSARRWRRGRSRSRRAASAALPRSWSLRRASTSDRVARLCGVDPGVRIVPFRGEYYELVPRGPRAWCATSSTRCPIPSFPFLGVHFTRRVDGAIEAGPNAVLAWKREGYSRTTSRCATRPSMLAFPGFWRMAPRLRAHRSRGVSRRWSRGALRALRCSDSCPRSPRATSRPAGCGVRAQALDRARQARRRLRLRRGRAPWSTCSTPRRPRRPPALAIGGRAPRAAEACCRDRRA